MKFQDWWKENKNSVCFDFVHSMGLKELTEKLDLQLMHIACQAWVAAEMEMEDNS